MSQRSPFLRQLIVLGSVSVATLASALPASAGYLLPWKQCVYRSVTQSWNSSPSHTGSMYYAYDFAFSEGTEVRAVFGGTVAHVKNNIPASSCCSTSACANNANYVTLNHSDGKATLYLHLQSTSVGAGAGVSRGQRVGYSGKTGWTSCGPHLHYQRQGQGIWFTNSVSGYFDEYPNTQLLKNVSYRSQNFWPGDNCPQLRTPEASEDHLTADLHLTDVDLRVLPLDSATVELLAAGGESMTMEVAELGLSYRHPADLDPVVYIATQSTAGWPAYLPTWNLHFEAPTADGAMVPLDSEIEGYAGQFQVRELFRLSQAAGSHENVQFVGKRITAAGTTVSLWRWTNVAGSFLTAARVTKNGIVMIHTNVDVLTAEGGPAALDTMTDSYLLPQLDRIQWQGKPQIPTTGSAAGLQ